MPVDPMFEPATAQKLIRAAKDQAVSFAFGLGGEPDKHLLAVDKKKDGKALFALLKKENGATKGSWGTVLFKDGSAVFSCEKDGITGLGKLLEVHFKRAKITLSVEIADGATAEEGSTEAEARARGSRQAPTDVDDADDETEVDDDLPDNRLFDPVIVKALVKKARKVPVGFAFGIDRERSLFVLHAKKAGMALAKLTKAEGAAKGSWGVLQVEGKEAVFECEKAPISGLKKRLKAWFKENGLAYTIRVTGPDGDFDDPDDVETVAEAADQRSSQSPPVAEELERLKARIADMMPSLRTIGTTVPARTDAIKALLAEFRTVLAASDAARAREIVFELAVLARPVAGASEEIRSGTVEFAKIRLDWQSAKKAVEAELADLRDAMETDGDDEEAAVIATAVRKLDGVLARFNEGLADTIDAMTNATDAAGRSDLQRKAGDIARSYLSYIGSDPIIRHLETNPYQPLKIADTLRAPLSALTDKLMATA
ncbi:hypothetical protein [Arenibaculum pallidiluteum]|uniref:hypothetical protein n=1 Tax=Arenibaculum pallidiluteum TaxID=2812559 RepID=UPI001A96B2D0|nr:hypothetical protein [Arenibaculum pallidiluteum]